MSPPQILKFGFGRTPLEVPRVVNACLRVTVLLLTKVLLLPFLSN